MKSSNPSSRDISISCLALRPDVMTTGRPARVQPRDGQRGVERGDAVAVPDQAGAASEERAVQVGVEDLDAGEAPTDLRQLVEERDVIGHGAIVLPKGEAYPSLGR